MGKFTIDLGDPDQIGEPPHWLVQYRRQRREEEPMTPQELRRLRRRAKLTQAALAQRLGVTETTVARWERGARSISPAHANLIRLTLKTKGGTR